MKEQIQEQRKREQQKEQVSELRVHQPQGPREHHRDHALVHLCCLLLVLSCVGLCRQGTA